MTRYYQPFAAVFTVAILAGWTAYAQDVSAGNSDPLSVEVSKLSAPYHPISPKVTRPAERRLPSGDLNVEQELKWRVLYEPGSKMGRAASRVVWPGVAPGQLNKFIERIEAVDDTEGTRVPNVAELQDPRAIPALRRALDRLKTPMKRLFVLQALYACGDWNHPDELITLIQERVHAGAAFDLLALHHPVEATQASLELLEATDRVQYGLNKRRSHAMVGKAITALERLGYPNLDEVYMAYFEKWPAPLIARKFGDRKTVAAEPMVRKALADAPDSPFFNNFKSIMSYRYALAQLGDEDSMNWMLDKATLLKGAPDMGDPTRNSWEKVNGITSGDVGPFCNLLVKLGTKEALTAYVDLLINEAGNRVQSSISPASLYLIKDETVVDALELYFERHGAREKKMDLTDPKKVLALYPDNPKAMKLLEEFVPEKEKRDDLLSLAREFGAAGLNPNAAPPLGREGSE